eukprot:5153726-Pleurochrysis_carterae.AAC.7
MAGLLPTPAAERRQALLAGAALEQRREGAQVARVVAKVRLEETFKQEHQMQPRRAGHLHHDDQAEGCVRRARRQRVGRHDVLDLVSRWNDEHAAETKRGRGGSLLDLIVEIVLRSDLKELRRRFAPCMLACALAEILNIGEAPLRQPLIQCSAAGRGRVVHHFFSTLLRRAAGCHRRFLCDRPEFISRQAASELACSAWDSDACSALGGASPTAASADPSGMPATPVSAARAGCGSPTGANVAASALPPSTALASTCACSPCRLLKIEAACTPSAHRSLDKGALHARAATVEPVAPPFESSFESSLAAAFAAPSPPSALSSVPLPSPLPPRPMPAVPCTNLLTKRARPDPPPPPRAPLSSHPVSTTICTSDDEPVSSSAVTLTQ